MPQGWGRLNFPAPVDPNAFNPNAFVGPTQNRDTEIEKQQLDEFNRKSAIERFIRGAYGKLAGLGYPGQPSGSALGQEGLHYNGRPVLENIKSGITPSWKAQDIGGMGADLAGIPFPAGKKVFHGTPALDKVLESGMNPLEHGDHGDFLGWMSHFAERPDYADEYARNASSVRGIRGKPKSSGIIPAELNAKNVIDLYDPEGLSSKDIKDVLKVLPASKKIEFIKRIPYESASSILERYLQDMNVNQFRNTKFDGVRFNSMGEPSWAVPDPNQIISPYTKLPINKKK